MDFGIPDISLPSTGGGHSAGCRTLKVVFLIVAALMIAFIAVIGWVFRSAGV